MVHALAKEIAFPEKMIRDAIRKVFKFRGSLEYPVRAEDLAFLEGRSKSEIEDLNRLMFGAFRRCRRKNLKLYDGVLEFLEWIQVRQITLVAVTNAPLEIAQACLVDLGVSQFYSAIAGPVWSNVTEDNSNSGFQQILFDTPPKKRRTLDRHFKRVYGLTPEQRKPSPVAYQFFLNGSGPERRNDYVIGDSLQNDLAPARLL